MRESALYTSQLFNACHVLFGSDINVSLDFIHYLQMPGLKAAFRKKALETHPDRAALLDLQTLDLENRFKQVNAAYRDLSHYLENPLNFVLIDDSSRGGRSVRSQGADRRQRGHARPHHSRDQHERPSFKGSSTGSGAKYLFGRFLYYNGLITYRQLIDALVWQKAQRPTLGNLAMRWRWLYEQEIRDILLKRRFGEKFGECALRHGYLTPEKLRMLLSRQSFLQPRIGSYFIEKGILTPLSVERMAEKLRRHNRQHKGK